jgi:hypothetical protein
MAGLAQLVRALGCGSKGRGFDPHSSPQIKYHNKRRPEFLDAFVYFLVLRLQ